MVLSQQWGPNLLDDLYLNWWRVLHIPLNSSTDALIICFNTKFNPYFVFILKVEYYYFDVQVSSQVSITKMAFTEIPFSVVYSNTHFCFDIENIPEPI